MTAREIVSGLRRRIGLGLVLLACASLCVSATLSAVFVYGDALGDAFLVIGHRLKNAGTRVESDGMVSLVYLKQAAGEQAALDAAARRQQILNAQAELRAATILAQSQPTKQPKKGK